MNNRYSVRSLESINEIEIYVQDPRVKQKGQIILQTHMDFETPYVVGQMHFVLICSGIIYIKTLLLNFVVL